MCPSLALYYLQDVPQKNITSLFLPINQNKQIQSIKFAANDLITMKKSVKNYCSTKEAWTKRQTKPRIKEGFRYFRSIRSTCGLSPILKKVQNSCHGLQHCEGPQTKETIAKAQFSF